MMDSVVSCGLTLTLRGILALVFEPSSSRSSKETDLPTPDRFLGVCVSSFDTRSEMSILDCVSFGYVPGKGLLGHCAAEGQERLALPARIWALKGTEFCEILKFLLSRYQYGSMDIGEHKLRTI